MAFRLLSLLGPLLGLTPAAPQWRSGEGDPVVSLAATGEILAASSGASALIAAEGGLARRSLYDFVSREDRAGLKSALEAAIAAPAGSTAARALVRLLRPGQSALFAELLFARDGRRVTVLIRERAHELAAAREERAHPQLAAPAAAAAPAGVSPDALADLGHELKTPLNAIMGFAETMKSEAFGPLGHDKYREYAGFIHSSGGHLADLIASILDRAKIDAGRYKLTPALSAPGAIARDCAEMVRGEAEKAGLALRVDIAPDLDETMIDGRAVKQILINLLSNAVKFTAAGEIGLRVFQTKGEMSFEVCDTGVGMSQMALARLGERFTGLHKSGVRGTSGTGLGLSLAFSLARLHGGALELSSAPGEGTIARLRLPIARSLTELSSAGVAVSGDIQSQLDRVAQFRRERSSAA
jgi:signal transduction histidine kinase